MTDRERSLLLQNQRLREQVKAQELELEKFRRGQTLIESVPEAERAALWRDFQDMEALIAERDEARDGEYPAPMSSGACSVCGDRSDVPHTWRACAEGLALQLKRAKAELLKLRPDWI